MKTIEEYLNELEKINHSKRAKKVMLNKCHQMLINYEGEDNDFINYMRRFQDLGGVYTRSVN